MTTPTIECKKCGQPTQLIYGKCEDCLIYTLKHKRFKERPICRKKIEQYLSEISGLTLCKIAFWEQYDTVPLIPSDAIRTQAKKMLQEQRWIHR